MCGGNCGQKTQGNQYSCPYCEQKFIALCGGRILTFAQYEEMVAKEKAEAEENAKRKAFFDEQVEEIWNSFDFRPIRKMFKTENVLLSGFALFLVVNLFGSIPCIFFGLTVEDVGVYGEWLQYLWNSKDLSFVLSVMFLFTFMPSLMNSLLFHVRLREYFEKHPVYEPYKKALLEKLDPPSPHGAVGM